ncbi:MAG: EAL domain-containing protein [Actinomycetota bacterium]
MTEQVGEFFAAWARAAGVGLMVTRPSGSIDYVNEQCSAMTGLVAGDHLLHAFRAGEVERVAESVDRLRALGVPVDLTAQLATSETIARFLISRTVDEHDNISALIAVFRDVTSQGLHERQLEYRADHDDLTGLSSRAAIMRTLREKCEQGRGPVTAMFVDLDDFKGINDAFGHLAGDDFLRVVAQRLATVVPERGAAARMGGDEFLIVFDSADSIEQIAAVADRVSAVLSEPLPLRGTSVSPRFSIGVAVDGIDEAHETLPSGRVAAGHTPQARAERLLAEADMSMYVAKGSGTPIAFADESTRLWNSRRFTIDRDLAVSLSRETVDFHYQPIVDLFDECWTGAEALLRWDHPSLGVLPPALVFERAEVIGCVDELTTYCFDRVYRDWAEVQRRIHVMATRAVSMNVSNRQLSWDGFYSAYTRALDRHSLEPEDTAFEVTELHRGELHPTAVHTLRRLADAGASVSLDDFGVGYNALSLFGQFPIHGIKLSRSLVHNRNVGGVQQMVLKGIVRLARELGAKVVAEGIEQDSDRTVCREIGVGLGQGSRLAPPLSANKFAIMAEVAHSAREAQSVGGARSVSDHVEERSPSQHAASSESRAGVPGA